MPEISEAQIIETVKAELLKAQAQNNVQDPSQSTTQQTNQQTQQVQQDGPLTVTIAGQQHTFANKAQMEQALTQTFQRVSNELDTLRNPSPPVQRDGGFVSGKETPEPFSQEKYIKLMGEGSEGILAAHRYALNHAIFEGKEADATSVIRTQLEEIKTLRSAAAVYQFRELHPEFPMTQDATKIVDGIRRELNQPFTLEGLESAYGVAQARGLVPSPQVIAYQQALINQGILPNPQTQQNQQQNGPPPAAGQYSSAQFNGGLGFQPPPSVNRAAAAPGADIVALAEDMPLDQLEKVLRKQGLMR